MPTKQPKKRKKTQLCKSQQIIGSFYAKHFTLLRYLRKVQQGKAVRVIQDGDPHDYRVLLKSTLVAIPRDQPVTPPFKPSTTQWFTLKEIINQVIKQKTNVLAYGFEPLTANGNKGTVAGTVGIQNSYPNTIVSYLRTARTWQLLHERIGDDLMIHLLQNVAMFVKANSKCLFQVSGYPITRLSPLTPEVVSPPLPIKQAVETTGDKDASNTVQKKKMRRGGKRVQRYHKNVNIESGDMSTTLAQMNRSSNDLDVQLPEVPQRNSKRKLDSCDSVNNDDSREHPHPSKKLRTASSVDEASSSLFSVDTVEISVKSSMKSTSAGLNFVLGQFKVTPLTKTVTEELENVTKKQSYTDTADLSEAQNDVMSTPKYGFTDNVTTEGSPLLFPEETSKTSLDDSTELCFQNQSGLGIPKTVSVEEVKTLKRKKSISSAIKEKKGTYKARVKNKPWEYLVKFLPKSTEQSKSSRNEQSSQKVPQSKSQPKKRNGQQLHNNNGCPALKKNRKNIHLNEVLLPHSKLLYSSNLSQRFPKNHVVETLPVSMAGAHRLVRHIFLQGKCLGSIGDSGGIKKSCSKEQSVKNVRQGALDNRNGSKTLKLTTGRKRKPSRLPKKLKKVQPMLLRFLARHKKCPFRTLLRVHCHYTQEREVIKKGRKKRMLQRVPFSVKMVYRKLSWKSRAKSTKRTHQKKKAKVDVLRYRQAVSNYTEHDQVVRFLKCICNKVVPKELWGSSENKETFFRNLAKFIRLYRAEKFTLAQMMAGIKVSSCEWLQVKKSEKKKHVPLSDSCKRLELLSQFIWWFVTNYLMVVLKTFFYITESGIHRQRVFYYRKPIWEKIHQFGLTTFCGKFFKPLKTAEAENLLRRPSSLGFSPLRFIPKTSTVRPITNMRHCPTSKEPIGAQKQQSVNLKLQNLFEVLKFEKERNPKNLGATLFGSDDLYRALKPFVSRVRTRLEGRPLYFVHVDVSHCYESILHQKLFDIMKEVLEEEQYLIRRFALLRMAGGKVYRKFYKHVSTADDCRWFPDFFRSLVVAWKLKQVVAVDSVWYADELRDKLVKMLGEHIFNNIVRIGNNYYQQKRGIAQGSILSTMLCGCYYTQMERTHLSEVAQDPDSLLLRWVDDFLFITPDRKLADKFLNIMHAGIPEYGCVINRDKTLTNYAAVTADNKEVKRIGVDDRFPWCGFLLDQVTLEVSPDLSRYTGLFLRDTLTVSLDAHPGQALRKKLQYSVRPKCHPLLLDPNLNTRESILLNVFHVFLLTAYKFHTYVKELPRGSKPKDNPSFFCQMILDLAQYFYSASARKCRQLSPGEVAFSLDEREVTWLCLYAFQTCLRRTQSRYRVILRFLRKGLSQIPLCHRIKLPDSPWNAALTKLVRKKKS